MAECKTRMFCTFSFSLIDSIDVLSDMLEPKASSATQDRSEMGPLVFCPWLFFIFILILSRHRIMWGRRERRRQEGARGQCSQKRTKELQFGTSLHRHPFRKSVQNYPSSPRDFYLRAGPSKGDLPGQSLVRSILGPPLCRHPAFPTWALPLPSRILHLN